MNCGRQLNEAGKIVRREFNVSQCHQLRQELQKFVHDIPRRERTIGDANMATVHQMRELDRILDDFKEAIGWKE